jgi:hypothetical protein
MQILSLDIATSTGWAYGPSDKLPRSGSVLLRKPGQAYEIATGNMLAFLQEQFWTIKPFPELVVMERYMDPAGSKSGNATISSLLSYGAAQGYVRRWVPDHMIIDPVAATVRKHFIGRSNFKGRDETNCQVVRRCHLLGYMPRSDDDIDRASACALFDFAANVHVKTLDRVTPFEFFEA